MDPLLLTVIIIAFALTFDFLNGFHDSANSIATVVSTRVLSPGTAVVWAAVFNFVSAFTFGTQVAGTVGKGFVNLELVTPYVMLAGIIGAIVWDLITWWFGLPTSSSHALIGGYAGAAIARAAVLHGPSSSLSALTLSAWPPTLAFIVIAPLIGMAAAYVLMLLIYWTLRDRTRAQMHGYFTKLQLLSAAVLSFSHGTNDAQKTMGLITGVLVTAGYLKTFAVPVWVIFAAHTAIALGTLSGGWRVVHTMGRRLTPLKPYSGFCAEGGAACSILLATHLGLPVSTTHCLVGSIAGVGAVQRFKAVRWGVATRIVWAWVLTIPAAGATAAVVFLLIRLLNPAA
jgi:PiT family inorganic phosphate transporter